MSRPLVAITDIAAMRGNLSVARSMMPDARIWAVVKADAYGHGLFNALRAFDAADGLSLVEIDRAVALRDAGWRKPLMLMEGMFARADLATVQQHDFQLVIHCDEQLQMLEGASGSALHVHLKINSGMNRLGFRPERAREVWQRLNAMPVVSKISLLTHFANAENPHATLTAERQLQRFREGTAGLQAELSLSNSAALLLQSQLHCDWTRPGVMLYGGSPGGGSAHSFGLKPAMTLQSALIAVQDLQPGDSVGYGSVFTADRAMRTGVVACGYADGYPRHAPTGTPILVDGVRTRVLGRVSMDMISVDLTPVPAAGVGSRVTLWGDDLPIEEVANAAGTIGYELMCAITPRVRRETRGA
jgi:alanine racemase